MKLPVAIVLAVLVWSSARYLPPYFLELQKMTLVEQRMQMEAARQVAILKELRAHAQSQTKMSSETAAEQQNRFY
ncbi:hypothetical protein ACXR0O_07640 [Verrucomicrobiota bacterium sgz303538]